MRSFTRKNPRAIALMEMIICIGITGLLVSLGGVCYAQMIRLRGAQERYNARRLTAEYLLRRFADDVRPGHALLKNHGRYAAGERTLIIARDHGAVVYHVGKSKVTRVDATAPNTREDHIPLDKTMDARFEFDAPANARSAAMTIAWSEPPKIGISQPVLSLRAALRNRTKTE